MPPRVLASGPKACGGNKYNRVFILHSNYNLTGVLWYFSIGQQFSKGFSFHILYRVCTHLHNPSVWFIFIFVKQFILRSFLSIFL